MAENEILHKLMCFFCTIYVGSCIVHLVPKPFLVQFNPVHFSCVGYSWFIPIFLPVHGFVPNKPLSNDPLMPSQP